MLANSCSNLKFLQYKVYDFTKVKYYFKISKQQWKLKLGNMKRLLQKLQRM